MKKVLSLVICLVFILVGCEKKSNDVEKDKTIPAKSTKAKASVEELMKKCTNLVKEKKLEDALVVLDEIIKISGENRSILGYKYNLLMELKKYEEGLAVSLRRDEVAKRKSPWNCISIVEAYLKLNNTEKALEYLSIAVKERKFNNLHHLMGETYAQLKDNADFLALIAKVKEVIGIGKKATDFTVKLINGTEYTLSAQKGNVVLIDFWATWCPPCRKELPNIKKIYSQFKDKGFKIIGISLDTDEAKHKAYIEEKGMDWDLSYSGKGWYDDAVKLYNVSSIPSVWIIDRQGNLRSFDIHGEEFSSVIKELVEEKVQ